MNPLKASMTTTYISFINTVVGRAGSVADKGPHPWSGCDAVLLILMPVQAGKGGWGHTPGMAEAKNKREVGEDSEEVK